MQIAAFGDTMGAFDKLAPVGVWGGGGTLLHSGACWMYGWLRAAETTSPSEGSFCSFCLNTVPVKLTDYLCV